MIRIAFPGRCVSLIAAALVSAVSAGAQPVTRPKIERPQAQADGKTKRTNPPPRHLGIQLSQSYDAGDSYPTPAGRRALRRLAGAVALPTADNREASVRELTAPGQAFQDYAERKHGGRVTVLFAPDAERRQQLQEPGRIHDALRAARKTAVGRTANPVFIDPKTGLQLLATERLIVSLKPGISASAYFQENWKSVEPVWGTTNQFLLRLSGATAEEIFADVEKRSAHVEVEWAEPDFISEVVRDSTPNDAYFNRQWHLQNTGQGGGKAGADARLTAAWDLVKGSSNIVIAIMDDGVQLDHPDLQDAIFHNTAEIPGNSFDDDGNGLADDYNGYNFAALLADPSPYASDDNHGTAVAGVAAASGDNAVGTVGVAYGCRVLPVKLLEGDYSPTLSDVAKAMRYVGGLNSSGSPVWRGADVVNISLTFGQSFVTDAALSDLVTKGRNGRGCAVFVAAGNSASAWEPILYDVPSPGTYTLRWEYSKDTTDVYATGDDTVWLDSIMFPDGTQETFEGGTLPAGWTTSSSSPWTVATDGVNGNHALTGWNGFGSRSLRAGHLSHGQTNWVQCTRTLTAGRFVCWVWVSSELDYDFLDFRVNGSLQFSQSGVPILTPVVSYPANNANTIAVGASTDFDFRADYSQYGSQLDFVAPTDGGASAVVTTDRTGADGYNDGSEFDGAYTLEFGGTSGATPLSSGVAALVLSLNPYLTSTDIRALLRATCDKVGGVGYDTAGRNLFYGSGRINASRAVAQSRPNLVVTTGGPSSVNEGRSLTYTIQVRNSSSSRSGPITITNALPSGSTLVSAVPTPSSGVGGRLTFGSPSLAGGESWTATVTVTNVAVGTSVSVAGAYNGVLEPTLSDNVSTLKVPVLPIPHFLLTGSTQVEGNVGRSNAIIFVTLSNPSSETITVDYATVTNTALAGSDFVAIHGRLTFRPGETNKTILVPVIGDLRNEADETLAVRFSAPVNAVLDETVAVIAIVNDDALPTITVPNVVRKEGNAGASKAVFKFRLSAPSGRVVRVDFATIAGTALAGADFQETNGTVMFPPGKVTANVNVYVPGDRLLEQNETFMLVLSNPADALLERTSILCTIVNNDPLPKAFIDDATVAESNADMTNVLMTVRLARPAGEPVSLLYATTNGSALSGVDYVATNGVIIFAPGETNRTLAIPVLGDLIVESNKFFFVRLSAPTNAILSRPLARVTLTNDDAPVSLIAARESGAPVLVGAWENGAFRLSWRSAIGFTYAIEWRASLAEGEEWVPVSDLDAVHGDGSVLSRIDPAAQRRSQGFYRIRFHSATSPSSAK